MADRRKRPSPRVEAPARAESTVTTTTTTEFAPPQQEQEQRQKRGAPLELVLVAGLLFATVALGSLYGARNTTHQETVLRSRVPASIAASLHGGALPYFADKRNLFNKYFVKQAWGWTSAAAAAHLVANFLASPAVSDSRPRSSSPVFGLLKPVLRWWFATLWWLAVTSWFFGPSVVDRILVLTGAECVPADVVSHGDSTLAALHPKICSDRALAKGQGVLPYWRGGHDISGHVFLLVHATLVLATLFHNTFRRLFSASPRRGEAPLTPLERWTGYAALALMSLWWWMVLMTSLFFHRPEEKLSGFLFGVLGWILGEMLLS
jgi:hypothetical protein